MIVSRGFLQILQSLFTEWHCHFISALRGILNNQVMKGSETGRYLVSALLSGGDCSTVMLVWAWRETQTETLLENMD